MAESVRHSQAEEAIAQMLSEKQQIRESRAEAARQASVAASIAEAERQAAEAAVRAAEASRAAAEAEASRAAAAAEASRAAAAAEVSRAAASGGTTVIIGDSRASGFGIYGAWPAEYVFYTYSPVRQSDGMADSAAAYRPARVVFCNGLDDLVSYSASSAASRYEDYIRYFHSLSPSTQICVCAVLPVLQTALDKRPQLSSIGEFNGLLRSMCSRNGWIYLDASSGISPSCYYGDGIHFTPSWTRQWMSNIRSALGF